MSNELIPMQDMKEMAKYMGPLFQKKPEDLFALMLIASAEHKHPAIAAQEYDIINGRPALKASAVLSRFQAAGGKIQYIKRTDDEVTAKFTHEAGGTLSVTWNIERATKAGLLGNPTWKKYPCQMLTARVISEGVRAIYPACLTGFYVPEEVESFDPEPRNVTPAPTKADPTPVQKPKAPQSNSGATDAEVIPNPQEEPETRAEQAPVQPQAKKPIEDEDLVNRMLKAKASNIPAILDMIKKTHPNWKAADREQRERMVTAIEEQWEILKAPQPEEPKAAEAPAVTETQPDLVEKIFDGEVVEENALGIF